MTVETSDTVERLVISGTGPYEFSFRVFGESDIAVCVDSGDLDATALTIDTHYTVTLTDAGGSVTLTGDVASDYAGDTLDIRSNTAEYQPTSIRNQGRFLPEIHEDAFDRMTRQVQDLRRVVNSKFGYPDDTLLAGSMLNRAAWANRYLYVNVDGEIEPAIASTSAVSRSILADLLAGDAAQSSEDLAEVLGTQRTAAEIAATVTPINYTKYPSPWKDISRFVSDNTGTTDVTTQMQNAFAAEKNIMIPSGSYRISSPLVARVGMTITGAGAPGAAITARGCDAITVTGDSVLIEKLSIFSESSIGGADPKAHSGIKVTGDTNTQVNAVAVRDAFLQGFLNAINWEYAWDCVIDNVRTANCERSVRLFGECVNDYISNCKLLANSGEASILTLVNGADRSEGLMVVNSLLASGQYGIKSDGMIAMSVVGCIIDLISNKGMELTGVTSLNVHCPWIYAASSCIDIMDQASPLNIGGAISVANARTTGTGGHCIRIGTNNNGIAIHGGMVHLENAASGNYPIAHLGSGSISGVFVVNASPQKGMLIMAADVAISNNAGACTVNRTVSPNFTGSLTGCTTTPTGTINYEVVGEEVVLEVLTAIEGTSNTTAATITGLPAALWPARAQQVVGRTKDNGTIDFGVWQIGTNGVMTLHINAVSAVFTGSGTKGAPIQTLRYKRT